MKKLPAILLTVFFWSISVSMAWPAPLAYITNYGSNSVSVIDTAFNKVVATIAVGQQPYGVAVSPDGAWVYVTNSGSNNVSKIRTSDLRVTSQFKVGMTPYGIAMAPSGDRLFVANSGDNTVSVVDAGNRSIIATVPVGSAPHGVVVNPSGTKVYVTNYGSSNVSVIDTSSNSVVATAKVGQTPHGIAINPSGTRLYIACVLNNQIDVIDTSSLLVISTITGGTYPYCPVAKPDGKGYYATYYGDDNVLAFEEVGLSSATIPTGVGPHGTSVTDDAKRLYVANENSNTVTVVYPATNTVIDTIAVGKQPVAFGDFISSGVIESKPSMNVGFTPESATPGTAATFEYDVSRGEGDETVDVYAGALLPDGSLYFLGPSGFTPSTIPYLFNAPLSDVSGSFLLDFVLPGWLPQGAYTLGAVVVKQYEEPFDGSKWLSDLVTVQASFSLLSDAQQVFVETLGYPDMFVKTFSREGGMIRTDETWIYFKDGLSEFFINGMLVKEDTLAAEISVGPHLFRPENYGHDTSIGDITARHGPPLDIRTGVIGNSEFFQTFQADTHYIYGHIIFGFDKGGRLVSVLKGR